MTKSATCSDREVTTIQQAREALHECEARRQALLDLALDCIICTDSRTRITEFNLAAERMFRISRTAALGKDLVATVLAPAVRDRLRRELFATGAAAGVSVLGNRLETRAIRSDGAEFPAELTVTRLLIKGETAFTAYVRDITARKRAEETVLRLASIVESSQDAIISKDLGGRVTSWNKGAEQMYGYTAEEMIGKNISSIFPPGHANELPAIMEVLRAGHSIKNFETLRLAKDGRLVAVSLTVSPVFDSEQNIVGASAIAHDITERKIAEEALRRANETSIYASPVPIVAADTNSHVTMWNLAAAKVFGWTESEVIGKPNPIIPGDEVEEALLLHKRLLAGETLTGMEVRRQRRDGTLLDISLSASPLWDESHNVRGIIGFLTDITERKRAEEALRRTEEKFRGIFENAVEGIFQTTPEGKYVAANPALARMLGFDSPEELINTRDDIANQEYVNPELREQFKKLMEEHGVVHNFEYQAYRKDGKTVWVRENAHVVRNCAGQVLYFEGTVQDVTQHRALEDQVRQMQKIDAIGRLAGGVAHDFNNILMAISSYSELLDRKLPDADPRRGYLNEISKSVDRASSLTQGLLTFSRKQVFSPRVLDLNALVTNQATMLKRLIPENIDLKFLPGQNIGRVKVDPGQMEQVVMNLIINARDAMPDGGEILIETENTELAPSDFGLPDPMQPGNFVTLTVRDSGCGMDAETKSHIFEPFYTTKEQGKGTGLGLAIVYGIVKQNAGYISVQSEPGRGATFKIHLSRVEDSVVPDQREASTTSFGGNETILLVEDEEAVRESAAEYLMENGYRVLQAASGPEALAIATEYGEPIHLMLSDLIMPQISGKELSERIAVIHSETKVVFMSGYSNNLLSKQQILDPRHVLLHKPFRLALLGSRIREALGPSSSAIARADSPSTTI